jgi:transcriptional regulator with XRE-family HTH domain
VDAGLILKEVRIRSGLSRRRLAKMGGTSASTLSAYESGRSVPSVRTLERLVHSAGFQLQISLQPALTKPDERRAETIERLLHFTDQLPRRQRDTLQFPKFPAAPHR